MSAVYLLVALAIGAGVHRRLLGRLGAGTLQHLVRLPGNLLHELAHAVAMLATGFTVVGFTVSLFDRAGRGHVHPGPPWVPFARAWLTNLVSPVAPVVTGVVALAMIHAWCGAPGLVASADGLVAALRAAPWASWQLWVGLTVAFSVAAEMAPSGIDLAAWWRPALVAGLLAAVGAYALEQVAPGSVRDVLTTADTAARVPVTRALAMAVWSGLAFAPIAWGMGRLRG